MPNTATDQADVFVSVSLRMFNEDSEKWTWKLLGAGIARKRIRRVESQVPCFEKFIYSLQSCDLIIYTLKRSHGLKVEHEIADSKKSRI